MAIRLVPFRLDPAVRPGYGVAVPATVARRGCAREAMASTVCTPPSVSAR